MVPMRNAADSRVHFSELSKHALSPAHVKLACETSRVPTRPMIKGSVADDLVFFGGRNVALYTGKARNGKQWDEFQAENVGKILCIQSEYDEAAGAAEALLADPIARQLMDGAEFQRVAQWDAYGLPCATGIAGVRGGYDVLNLRPKHGRAPMIANMKTTASAEPETLSRHAWKMLWHASGAWDLDGARAMGMDVAEFWIIAVEGTPPHPVTCMRVPEAILNVGRKLLTRWMERHRACESAGAWPGYVQSEIEMTVPPWVEEE